MNAIRVPELRTEPYEKKYRTVSGYVGQGKEEGIFIPDADALEYALDRLGLHIYNVHLFDKELGKDHFCDFALEEVLNFRYDHEYLIEDE